MTTRRQFCVLLTATALSLDKGKSALFQNDSKADKDLAVIRRTAQDGPSLRSVDVDGLQPQQERDHTRS
jgi:hypothetical protein